MVRHALGSGWAGRSHETPYVLIPGIAQQRIWRPTPQQPTLRSMDIRSGSQHNRSKRMIELSAEP